MRSGVLICNVKLAKINRLALAIGTSKNYLSRVKISGILRIIGVRLLLAGKPKTRNFPLRDFVTIPNTSFVPFSSERDLFRQDTRARSAFERNLRSGTGRLF